MGKYFVIKECICSNDHEMHLLPGAFSDPKDALNAAKAVVKGKDIDSYVVEVIASCQGKFKIPSDLQAKIDAPKCKCCSDHGCHT